MTEERDPKDVRWKAARFAAMKRDGFMCRKCGAKEKLNGHHIIRWADSEKLRYISSNVITLCETCHAFVTGREDDFREEFQRLVAISMDQKRQDKKDANGRRFRPDYKPRDPRLRY